MIARASWLPQLQPLGSYSYIKGAAKRQWPDEHRCQARITGSWNHGQRCQIRSSHTFEGQRYCARHHPISKAETHAWRIYRQIAALEAEGFTVRLAARDAQ